MWYVCQTYKAIVTEFIVSVRYTDSTRNNVIGWMLDAVASFIPVLLCCFWSMGPMTRKSISKSSVRAGSDHTSFNAGKSYVTKQLIVITKSDFDY